MTQDDEAAAHREVVANWLQLAEADLDYAKLGLSASHIHPSLICFPSQQCVEKTLKAVLVHRGLGVPRTHDLTDLASRLVDEKSAIPAKALFPQLTPFGSAERYPGSGDAPGPQEVKEFLAGAGEVLN